MTTPVRREIDGTTYEVTQFMGIQCLKHYTALTNLVGEPIANALISFSENTGKKKESSVAYLDNSMFDIDARSAIPAVSEAFLTLTNKLTPDECVSLFTALLKNTMKMTTNADGKPIHAPVNMDMDFGGGRMKPLFILIMFVLEVNFADFLPDGFSLTKAVGDLAATAKAKS